MTFLRLLTRGCSNTAIGRRVIVCAARNQSNFVVRAGIKYCHRNFHVSPRYNALPFGVLLAKLATPAIRILGLLGGRMFRRIWKKLPSHVQSNIIQRIRHREDLWALVPGGCVAGVVVFYVINREETPMTGRVRLMPINRSQMKEVAQQGWRKKLEAFAQNILPVAHPDHQRVHRVMKQLIKSNKSDEVDRLHWELYVVDTELLNAFVFPNGQIFMFTGMLKALPNDDALAYILGHEMSHAIIGHSAEQAGIQGFGNMVYVVILGTISALLSDLITSILASWLQNQLLAYSVNLPYSRMLETEADEVGINLAAKACYDVREAPKFWKKLEHIQKDEQPAEWMSTHPSHGNRAKALQTLVPQALEMRKKCNCPPLPLMPQLAPRCYTARPGQTQQRPLANPVVMEGKPAN